MKILLLYLTCANKTEADTIGKHLLEKRLIACAKQMLVTAQFAWRDAIEQGNEILLVMETIESNAQVIENEVKKLHSYQTFVLIGVEAAYISDQARKWILEEVNQGKQS